MKFLKKAAILILAMLILINCNSTAYSAITNKQLEKVANIVYFVNFQDTKQDFTDKNFTDLVNMFDGNKHNSLSNYIKAISYNQMNVHNYFPQKSGKEIKPYTLSKPRSYYTQSNEYEMLSEVITNVKVDPSFNIDMNNDGYVDNLIFIFNGEPSGEGDVLWAHKASYIGGPSINNVKINNYNVHSTGRLLNSLVSGGEGVLAHEFLHTVGYPDLYRSTKGAPVGMWDIMASVSVFLQYPLAYTRSVVSNWISIDTITKEGTYTLNPATSQNGDQAFIIKTPMSDKEFFVVEYRKKTNSIEFELDSKIPGTGLIIYRVNTEYRSNYASKKDYIYVFRPGETVEGAGEGNLSNAFLSQQSGRTSYGSSDLSHKVSDGAITYSNGQNSGIVIENVGEAGDQITFDLKFTDTSTLGVWETVGKQSITNKADGNMAMEVVDDKIYTVYNEGDFNKILKAKVYNGSTWVNLGDNILNEKGNDPKIKVYKETPYVLYHDVNYKAVVAKYINGRWERVATLSKDISQYSDMEIENDNLYITYIDDKNTSTLKVVKLNEKTNSFEQFGSIIQSGYIANPNIKVNNGQVYLSYTNFYEGNKLYVKKYINGNWVDVSIPGITASYAKMIANDNGLYISIVPTYPSTDSYLYHYNGMSWNVVGDAIGGNEVSNLSVAINGDIPYVAYIDSNTYEVIVKYFDGTKWIKEGTSASDEAANNIDFSIYKGKAYVAVNTSNTSSLFVRFKDLSNNSTEDKNCLEDVNGDGIVDIQDLAIVAKRYNLKNTDADYYKKHDFNNDGIIDVFDIVHIAKFM